MTVMESKAGRVCRKASLKLKELAGLTPRPIKEPGRKPGKAQGKGLSFKPSFKGEKEVPRLAGRPSFKGLSYRQGVRRGMSMMEGRDNQGYEETTVSGEQRRVEEQIKEQWDRRQCSITRGGVRSRRRSYEGAVGKTVKRKAGRELNQAALKYLRMRAERIGVELVLICIELGFNILTLIP